MSVCVSVCEIEGEKDSEQGKKENNEWRQIEWLHAESICMHTHTLHPRNLSLYAYVCICMITHMVNNECTSEKSSSSNRVSLL